MKTARRFAKLVLSTTLMAALAATVVYTLFAPAIAEALIAAALRDAGIENAAFDVQYASMSRIDLSDVRLGDWASAGGVSMTYTFDSLRKGRVHAIVADEVEWRWRMRDGRVDFGPYFAGESVSGDRKDLPFDRLEARRLTIVLEHAQGVDRFRVDGAISRSQAETFALELQAHWAAMPQAAAAVHGTLAFANGQPLADVAAHVPAFDLIDDEPLRALSPHLQTAQFGGRFEINGQLTLSNGEFKPTIHILANEVYFHRQDWPLQIDRASASMTIDQFHPFETLPAQRVFMHEARLGGFAIREGEMTIDIADGRHVRVERATWNMGDLGRFRAAPFEFDAADPHFNLAIASCEVPLDPWLDVLTRGRAEGDGTLRGKVELAIRTGQDRSVIIRSGMLSAGSKAGTIRVHDRAVLARFLDQHADMHTSGGVMRNLRARLIDALTDYAYASLQIEFIPEGEHLLARVSTHGKGRTGSDPQEIGSLIVNIRDFNDALYEAMRIRTTLAMLE